MAAGRSTLRRHHLRLLQAQRLPSASPPSYPPIFLPPSSYDHPVPSPSPLPLPSAGHHHDVPTAAIVGSGVAGVVAVALTATVVSAVAGKLGLISCLLGPICKLLGPICKLFSCFFDKLPPSCAGIKRDSLCNLLRRLNPAKKKGVPKEGEDDDDEPMDLYAILGGDQSQRGPKKHESAAAAEEAYASAASPRYGMEKAEALLMKSMHDYAYSEITKQTEIMLQPVNERLAEAQGYAQAFLVVTDDVSDGIDTHLEKIRKLKADADHMKESAESAINAPVTWKINPADMQATWVLDEAVVDKETMRSTIESSGELRADAESKASRIKALQEPAAVAVEEEEAVLNHRMQGKSTVVSGREADRELEVAKQQPGAGELQLTVACQSRPPVCIVQSASDACAEVQLEAMRASSGAHEQVDTSGVASIPSNRTGGKLTNNPRATTIGTMVAIAAADGAMASAKKGRWRAGDGKGKKVMKQEASDNLGHVSFSCEISAHRLRFFTACRSGGTYGSPPPSYDHQQQYNYQYYEPEIHHNDHPASTDTTHHVPAYHGNVQLLTDAQGRHYTILNSQQQQQPSQSLVVQSHIAAPPLPQVHALPRLSPAIATRSQYTQTHIDHYGSPFDGFL